MRRVAIPMLVLVALISAPNSSQSAQDALRDRIDQLVKAWSDARFWIVVGEKKMGWQRYRMSWGELDGEKTLVVDFESVSITGGGDRFTAHLRPDDLLSPKSVRWGKSEASLRVENGKIMPFGDPRLGEPAPDHVTLFPELVAALRLPKSGEKIPLSPLVVYHTKCGAGQIEGTGKAAIPGAKRDAKQTTRVQASWKLALANPITVACEYWINDDASMAHAKIGGRTSSALVPAGEKDWNQDTVELNEMRAAASLGLLKDMQARLRMMDVDGNSEMDYWTGDVSSFHRLIPKRAKEPMELIPLDVAGADAAPLPQGAEKGGGSVAAALKAKPVAFRGYLFRAMTKGRLTRGPIDLNNGTNRNLDMFGFCAYPERYGKGGRKTFFVNEDGNIFSKDIKGAPVLEVPPDVRSDGWQVEGLTR